MCYTQYDWLSWWHWVDHIGYLFYRYEEAEGTYIYVCVFKRFPSKEREILKKKTTWCLNRQLSGLTGPSAGVEFLLWSAGGQMTYQCIISQLYGKRRSPCSFSHHPARTNPHSLDTELRLFLGALEENVLSQECRQLRRRYLESGWVPSSEPAASSWAIFLYFCLMSDPHVDMEPLEQHSVRAWRQPQEQMPPGSSAFSMSRLRGIWCQWKQGTWLFWAKTIPCQWGEGGGPEPVSRAPGNK